jgi:hypothetical protein
MTAQGLLWHGRPASPLLDGPSLAGHTTFGHST